MIRSVCGFFLTGLAACDIITSHSHVNLSRQKNKDEPVAFSVWTENVNKQIQDLIALIRGSTAIFIYNVMQNQISCNGEIRLEDFIANVIKGKSNVVSHLKEKGDV